MLLLLLLQMAKAYPLQLGALGNSYEQVKKMTVVEDMLQSMLQCSLCHWTSDSEPFAPCNPFSIL
jgi:hypothetical protein